MVTKKTVKKKTTVKKITSINHPIIKVKGFHNGWTIGIVTYKKLNCEFEMKNFIEPSEFGINKGCISKLHIVLKTTGSTILSYDRGWDVRPKSDFAKAIYKQFLKEFNKGMPEQYIARWNKSWDE